MNPDAKEYAASEAKRLLDELEPYFAEIERRAVEAILLTTKVLESDGDYKRRCLADRIIVIRELKGQLQSAITIGAQKRISRIA